MECGEILLGGANFRVPVRTLFQGIELAGTAPARTPRAALNRDEAQARACSTGQAGGIFCRLRLTGRHTPSYLESSAFRIDTMELRATS